MRAKCSSAQGLAEVAVVPLSLFRAASFRGDAFTTLVLKALGSEYLNLDGIFSLQPNN